MSNRLSRNAVVVVVVFCSAMVGMALPASAVAATSGSVALVSEPGDSVGLGGRFSYTVGDGDRFNVAASGGQAGIIGQSIQVSVDAADGEHWWLQFAAADGKPLVPGTYDGARRYSIGQKSGEPGIDVTGSVGSGCGELTGTFTVHEAVFGHPNYVERFHATFEQHCEGHSPALTGEIRFVNPPTPAPLSYTITTDPGAEVNVFTGKATVHGSITCNQPGHVYLTGILTQGGTNAEIVIPPGPTSCSTTPTAWTGTATSPSSAPFRAGGAQMEIRGMGSDALSEVHEQSVGRTVQLRPRLGLLGL